MSLKSELALVLSYLKINLKTILEYRANFLIQSFSMILNNCVWIIFWWIFMTKFESINGWAMLEILQLFAISTGGWGLVGILFGNKNEIARMISEGKLDFHLSLPKDILLHALQGKSSFFGVGDLIFSIIVALLVFPVTSLPLYLYFIFTATIILISFCVIVHSMSFFIENSSESSHKMVHGLLGFTMYPLSIFSGKAKIILLTLLPAGFISSVPVTLLNNFDLNWFLLLTGFTILIALIAKGIFSLGLKRYESGNMMNARI